MKTSKRTFLSFKVVYSHHSEYFDTKPNKELTSMIAQNRPQRIHKPRGKSSRRKHGTNGRGQRYPILPERMGEGFAGVTVSWMVWDHKTRKIPVTISSKNPDK